MALNESSKQPREGDTIIAPILQMRKLRLKRSNNLVKIRVVEHSGESRKGLRKRTNRELPQGGREQEKLGGLNTLPLKSITLWEAHQGGWGPVGRLASAGQGVKSLRLRRGTRPPPRPLLPVVSISPQMRILPTP